jgi:hypothetical protein
MFSENSLATKANRLPNSKLLPFSNQLEMFPGGMQAGQ